MIDPNFLRYSIDQKKQLIAITTEKDLPILIAEINGLTKKLNEMIDG